MHGNEVYPAAAAVSKELECSENDGEMVKGKENSSIPVSFAAKQEGGVSNVNTLLKRKGTAQERGQISIAKSAWAHAPTRASLTAMANALSSTLNSEQTHDRHASESCM